MLTAESFDTITIDSAFYICDDKYVKFILLCVFVSSVGDLYFVPIDGA